MIAPVRKKLVELALKTAADQAQHGNWRYAFVRPLHVPPAFIPGGHVDADCSKGCQFLCKWAGAPDPMDNGFASWGNSNTMWVELEHVAMSEVEAGDFFTFGYYAGEKHVCMAIESGLNPQVWNMGRQGQPAIRRYSDEVAAHLGMRVTCLKLPVADLPDPPATPEERLRARTGFYSWMGWRLGEGPWKRYGKRNRKVRPAVPSRIPAGWWRHYMMFITNRKKGNPSLTR